MNGTRMKRAAALVLAGILTAGSLLSGYRSITYSIPLRYDGQVYAVFGVEISLPALARQFFVSRENRKNDASYLVAIGEPNGTYRAIGGDGHLSSLLLGGDSFLLSPTKYESLSRIDGLLLGSDRVYASLGRLKLYGHNPPYANSNWVFLGLKSHSELFGMGESTYIWIIGMTNIALFPGQSREDMVRCLNKIADSSQYLLGLLNDILDMSKIESGKMQIVPEDFAMGEMLSTIRELIAPQMQEKKIQFVEEIQLETEWFCADRLRISQILVNILGNAVKFTPSGGTIRLTAALWRVLK